MARLAPATIPRCVRARRPPGLSLVLPLLGGMAQGGPAIVGSACLPPCLRLCLVGWLAGSAVPPPTRAHPPTPMH